MTPREFRDWRKRMGWTQEETARRFGVTPRAVIKWEAGDAPIGITTQIATQYFERQQQIEHSKEGGPKIYVVNAYPLPHECAPAAFFIVMATSAAQANEIVGADPRYVASHRLEVTAAADPPPGLSPGVLFVQEALGQ